MLTIQKGRTRGTKTLPDTEKALALQKWSSLASRERLHRLSCTLNDGEQTCWRKCFTQLSHFNDGVIPEGASLDVIAEERLLSYYYECKLKGDCEYGQGQGKKKNQGSHLSLVYSPSDHGTTDLNRHGRKCFPGIYGEKEEDEAIKGKFPSLFSATSSQRDKVGIAVHRIIAAGSLPFAFIDAHSGHVRTRSGALLRRRVQILENVEAARANLRLIERGIPTTA